MVHHKVEPYNQVNQAESSI